MIILIVSDDHGIDGFEKVLADTRKKYGTVDAVLHAGDGERGSETYYQVRCGDTDFYGVKGNNDYGQIPSERVIELGGKRIFLTHGNRYNVYFGIESLYMAGLDRGCSIIVYGHTHQANHQQGKDVQLINPGSLTGIRSRSKSYAVLMIDDEGNTKVDFCQY